MKYEDKELIVSDAWLDIERAETWGPVVRYCDVGLPLAYSAVNGFCVVKEEGKAFIEETYNVLRSALKIPDREYKSWSEMCSLSNELREDTNEV